MFFSNYHKLVETILNHHECAYEANARTGRNIRVLPHPASFLIDLECRRLPLPGNRKVYPKTAAAEIAWFLSGEKDLTWLRKYCRIWDLFQEDDGTVESAYGYRWIRHFGRDQVLDAMLALQENPTDRRVYVSAWDPATDGLGRPSKNVPCPLGFVANVVNGKLNMQVTIRSSDVFVGLPYDVMGHALLADAFATSLGIRPGYLHFTLAHAHIYETHFEMAREGLKKTWAEMPRLPEWSLAAIRSYPDEYVEAVKSLADGVRWPEFNPLPEVVV